jgi:hypothetical protein
VYKLTKNEIVRIGQNTGKSAENLTKEDLKTSIKS